MFTEGFSGFTVVDTIGSSGFTDVVRDCSCCLTVVLTDSFSGFTVVATNGLSGFSDVLADSFSDIGDIGGGGGLFGFVDDVAHGSSGSTEVVRRGLTGLSGFSGRFSVFVEVATTGFFCFAFCCFSSFTDMATFGSFIFVNVGWTVLSGIVDAVSSCNFLTLSAKSLSTGEDLAISLRILYAFALLRK